MSDKKETLDESFDRLLGEYRQAMMLRWIHESQDKAAHNLAAFVSRKKYAEALRRKHAEALAVAKRLAEALEQNAIDCCDGDVAHEDKCPAGAALSAFEKLLEGQR